MSTEKSMQVGDAFMEQMRQDAAVALRVRIERKELMNKQGLQERPGLIAGHACLCQGVA